MQLIDSSERAVQTITLSLHNRKGNLAPNFDSNNLIISYSANHVSCAVSALNFDTCFSHNFKHTLIFHFLRYIEKADILKNCLLPFIDTSCITSRRLLNICGISYKHQIWRKC